VALTHENSKNTIKMGEKLMQFQKTE
jgi:hypothetical protein